METLGISTDTPWLWGTFALLLLVMLGLDLGVFHRHPHAIRVREAAAWSAVWVALALMFNAAVWLRLGREAGISFLTGYLIEKSLSVDNIFVFVLIFGAFGIPSQYQHRVLFWGVLGALVLRGLMIVAGAALLARFHALIYVFGAFLLITGTKLVHDGLVGRDEGPARMLRFVRRVIPATDQLHDGHFMVSEQGRLIATPLLLSLVAVELADVVFAIDSIPAVFAVTLDPFIVFTSNVFAILGLRSLFFLVSELVQKLVYLKIGLGLVLTFVGTKMVLNDVVPISALVSLAVVTGILLAATLASLIYTRRHRPGTHARDAL